MRNKAKKFLSLVLSLSMVLSLLCVGASAGVEPVTADETWGTNYETETEFTIEDAAELLQFAVLVNDGKNFQDKTVTLTYNIDLTDVVWTPIGDNSHPFKGTFDGGEKTISNLKLSSGTYRGLFGYTGVGAVVKDFTLDGVTMEKTSTYECGAVSAVNYGVIRNVMVKRLNLNHKQPSTIGGLGGIVGHNEDEDALVDGCFVLSGSITSTGNQNYSRIGGIVGFNQGGTVRNCMNCASVTAESQEVGGITGYNYHQNQTGIGVLENCVNVGAISGGGNKIGGIAGSNYCDCIYNCVNGGKVTATGGNYGSVVGSMSQGTIQHCYGVKGTTSKGIGYGSGGITMVNNTKEELAGLRDTLNSYTNEKRDVSTYYEWKYDENWYVSESTLGNYPCPVLTTLKVITPPVAKTGLVYSGSKQALFTDGIASGGTMKYYVLEADTKPDTDPAFAWDTSANVKQTDAGTYQVWYCVVGASETSSPIYLGAVTISSKSFSDDATKDDFIVELTGNPLKENDTEQTQNFIVKDQKIGVGGTALTEGVDFTVSTNPEKDNKGTAAAEYTMEITGKGNYTGTLSKKFVILEADKDYSGNVTVTVSPKDGVPTTKLDTEKNTAIQAVATAEELSKVATGAKLTISLEVSPLDETTLSTEVQSAIAEKTGDLTKGVYLDIDLFKWLNSESEAKTEITETKVPLTITIDVPEEIQAQNRTYYIIREHEGQVDVINGTYDETNKTLTFNTDKFSTYAIYYKDITPPAPATGGGTTTYKITGEDTVNGKLTISKKYASSGTKITVTVESDRGYELTSLTVTAKNGKAVTITAAKDGGEYTFVMPGSDVVVSAKFTCTKDEHCPIAPFTDSKPDSWYHDAVHFCIEEGLMNGITSESFAPYGTTTRGMVTAILYRLANCPAVSEATTYTDVKPTHYYADAIAWAEDYNVVLGYGNGKFGPGDCITREQMAALLYRYAGSVVGGLDMEEGADLSSFEDSGKISAYAVPALRWAVKCGLMEGRPGNLLAPTDKISRAETAVMIYRFIAILNR